MVAAFEKGCIVQVRKRNEQSTVELKYMVYFRNCKCGHFCSVVCILEKPLGSSKTDYYRANGKNRGRILKTYQPVFLEQH